jgi:DNA helicase-2/ATP-dependent DNA helicase PcrA
VTKANIGVKGLSAVKPGVRYAQAFERLRSALEDADEKGIPVEEMGERLLEYYMPILKQKYDDYPKRAKDLSQLLTIMDRYENLGHFLSDMALEPPSASVNDVLATDDRDEHLVLSTIHSAKGLEWHTVFIIWALEGRFPAMYAARSEEEMEEELRLMYVAATRAKENLYFTYPVNVYDHGLGTVFSRLSRFIDGISEEILAPWSLVAGED